MMNKVINENTHMRHIQPADDIVPTLRNRCVKCNGNHKFSPFNVTIEQRNQQVTALPILIFDNSGYYIVSTVRGSDIKKYNNVTKRMIADNNYPENFGLFWSDGLAMFDHDNGLITMLVKNNEKINSNTIETLVKTIYCPDWWDDFINAVVTNPINSEVLSNTIERAMSYHDKADIFAKNFDKCLKGYNYPKFTRALRIMRERQKRENELQLQIIQKQKEEELRIHRLEEEEELKLKEQKEIEELELVLLHTKTFEQQFVENLYAEKKTHVCKFLATINPDQTTISHVIMKAGEVSKLQSGIESDDRIQKIKVYEYYLQQEREIKEGVKYKKPEWKKNDNKNVDAIPEIPVPPSNPNKPKTLLILNNVQKKQYEKIWLDHKNSKQNSSSHFVLDPWQTEAIEHIRAGRSCLITGPTSGGKTYVMMKGLDNIINSNNNNNIVYVSPTFHLAYQTYANIRVTFPQRITAFVTAEIMVIPPDANIFIGTAPELLNYFTTTKKKFHIGIFDEIHVASVLYCESDNRYDMIRANAYSRLLTRCENEVIAASATIENENDMLRYIVDRMNVNRKENKLKIEDIHLVKYENRVIPLNEYRFINNSTIIPIIRDTNGKDINPEIKTNNVISAENLFKLLVQMRNKEMIPAIVFDITDDIAWKTYINLINFVETKEMEDYADYNNMIERINIVINRFNTERESKMSTIPENDLIDITKKGNGRRDAGLRSIRSQRIKAYENIINDAKTVLMRSIIKFNTSEINSLSVLNKENIPKQILTKIIKIFGDNSLLQHYPSFKINHSHLNMIEIIKRLEDVNSDYDEAICQLNIDKGSYYRFASSCGMEQLKAIREPGSNEEHWKLRKLMIALAESQHINPKDIDGIIDIIMRGFEFGIAIINPSLPFVIQNIILDNLRTKNLGVVIASESMSMGINYPLRSVVIKSHNEALHLNPGKMIQMAGRCGRRGKDTQAHVIYWGIDNANEAHYTNIPPIKYPDSFILNEESETAGSIINDHKKLAVDLGIIYKTLYFEDNKKVINTSKLSRCAKNIINESDENDEQERKQCEKRRNEVQLTRSRYIEPFVRKLAICVGYNSNEVDELADMICKIDGNIIMESFSIESFQKSRHINLLMHMIIELHNKYAMCVNNDFLKFLENMIHILQTCEYRLIKLAK